ncbi:MAG: PAS domain S-box protein, partial [Thermoanaerobaculales bacterium]|nr:PAS domain S-box protein [Thermoanaerobaculales bacterium]
MTENTENPVTSDAHWFSALAESAWFAVFAHRGGGRVIYANSATTELTGYDNEELLCLSITDFIDGDFLENLPPPNRETGVYPRFEEPVELQVHRKDGATRWVAVTNGHIQIGDQVAGIGTAVDITQRKIAKQALTRRLELENALTDISRNFLALPPEKLKNGIEYALEKLNEAAHSDCTFLVLLAPDEETITTELSYHEGKKSKGDPRNCVIGDFGISRADLLLGEVLTLSGEDGEKAAQACCCDSAYRKRSSSLMPLLAGERLL